MLDRRRLVGLFAATAFAPAVAAAPAQTRPDSPGSEDGPSRLRTGSWNVTETLWPTPDAEPLVTTGLVADRRMRGTILQETIRSPTDPDDVKRIDYLKYDRVEGRWDYVSLETRVAIGIMPAWSYGPETGGRITLLFESFATAGAGGTPSGTMLRMRQIIDWSQPDSDTKDQFFALAESSGRSWLAHRYAYVRRP